MPRERSYEPKDWVLQEEVSSGLGEAQEFARTLDFNEAKSGEWFFSLLRRVVRTYDRNARAEYFRQKYPGLEPDEIADILTSVTVRYAAIAGALTGAAATASLIGTLGSAGMTASLFVGSIGAEMVYLARIQMRLVLDLSVVYDLRLDPEDPEDVLMVFGYALGVAPVGLLGKGVREVAMRGSTGAVKRYISGSTLKALQDFARRLGFKVLQRTVLKYVVPVASTAAGSGYNYVSTKAVGKIAKAHFKSRGKVVEELRTLVSRRNVYDPVFPAAVLHLAGVDGEVSVEEKALYRAMLSRLSVREHDPAEFSRLVGEGEAIIGRMALIVDAEVRRSLIDVLVLMATCDGELAEEERVFLAKAAKQLGTRLDLVRAERKVQDYRVVVKQNAFGKTVKAAGTAATRAVEAAGGRAKGARRAATATGGTVGRRLGGVIKRNRGSQADVTDDEEPGGDAGSK